MHQLIPIILTVAVLLIAWYCTERFSPDPLLTKIVQIIIFVAALILIVVKILPMAGLNF